MANKNNDLQKSGKIPPVKSHMESEGATDNDTKINEDKPSRTTQKRPDPSHPN